MKIPTCPHWTWALAAGLLVMQPGCHSPRTPQEGTEPARAGKVRKASDPARTTSSAARGDKATRNTADLLEGAEGQEVLFSENYDTEIREILQLTRRGKWEEAELLASALYLSDPNDATVQRLNSWVGQQKDTARAQALEDAIRDIDAGNSVFNPSLKRLFTEKKDRGLPPRKDLRDAVQQIESSPYVPESYGKTIELKGRLFDFTTEAGRMAKILDREISAHLDDVTLEQIVFDVGQAEGINFIADKSLPAFQKKISLNMDRVKLSEFLKYLERNLELQFQVGEDLIWIVDGKDSSKTLEETRFFRLRKGFVLPAQFGAHEVEKVSVNNKGVITTTEKEKIEQFVLDGAPEQPAIEQAIAKFYRGTNYLIDYERNLIVATGTRDQLATLEKIIQEFDRPVQQVLIEARFVTVTEGAFLQLGALWETGRGTLTGDRTATDFTGLARDFGVGRGLEETFGNILNRENLSVTLTALEQSGESQTLSSPRLTLVNNRPARISDGKIQYYYEEYTVQQQVTDRATSSSLLPKGTPSKITAGVSLDVMASIGGDGQSVLLALHPTVNQDVQLVTFATVEDRNAAGDIISRFDIKLPESRTQEIETRVVVRSGETVVMGGVLEREQVTLVESVPVLGNIPFLGAAFRKRTEVDKPRYLLIFVTATLLSETGEYIIHRNPESVGQDE